MSKERLEEISERVIVDKVYYKYLDGTKGRWGKTYTLNEEDYDHLIEQAERVQELERQVEVCQKYLNKHIDWLRLENRIYDLEEQNRRYRKALELIKLKTLDIKGNKDTRPFQIYGIASEALEDQK